MSLQTSITRRGSSYYCRIRVPHDLVAAINRKELRCSLRTTKPGDARRLGSRALARAHDLFQVLRDPMLSRDDKERLIRTFYSKLLDIDEQGRINSNVNPRRGRYLDNSIRDRANQEQQFRTALARGDYSFASDVVREVAKIVGAGEHAEELAGDRAFLQFITRAMVEATQAKKARDEGRFDYEPTDTLFHEPAAVILPATPAPASPVQTERSLRQNSTPLELLPEFFDERHPSDDSQEIYTAVLTLFERIVGPKPIADLTRDDVLTFRNKLLIVPTNYRKHFKTDDVFAAIETNRMLGKKGVPTLSDKTINEKYLAFLRSFLIWSSDQNLAAPQLVERMRVKRSQKGTTARRRLPYTTAQLQKLFSARLFRGCKSESRIFEGGEVHIRDWRFWIVVLGLTGCRLNELGQLRLSDVKDAVGAPDVPAARDYPHLHITIDDEDDEPGERRSLKTEQSVRYVPLHPFIVDLGFLDYVSTLREAGHVRVFPTWRPGKTGKYSNPASKWYARLLRDLGLKTAQLTYHSHRHTVIDRMRAAQVDRDARYLICGHSGLSAGEAAPSAQILYGHGLDELFRFLGKEMMKVRFDDIDWSAVPRVPFKAPTRERRRTMSRATPEAAN